MSSSLKNKYVIGAFLASLCLLLLLQTPLFRGFRDNVWHKIIVTTGVVFRVGEFRVDNSVNDQMQTLLARNIRLRAENLDYRRLQEQLGCLARDDFNEVPAMIIGYPADIFKSQYVLNKGAADGVVLGAPVVINNSILVGTIQELNNNTSLLRLLFHPETSLKAEVITEEEIINRGLVVGKTFTGLEMVEIPRDAMLAQDQEVVTMNQPGVIPQGLFIGRVNIIKSDDRDPYQKAQLSVPYNPGEIVAVSVLTPR